MPIGFSSENDDSLSRVGIGLTMNDAQQTTSGVNSAEQFHDTRRHLNRLERRDWWMWWHAIAVMLLLTAAIVSFAYPGYLRDSDLVAQFRLEQAVRGLVGMVLLFNVYVIYQQFVIKRLRRTALQHQLRAEEFMRLAMLDPLTSLHNRRFGEDRLKAEVSRSQRHGHPLSVLIVDLNDFKQINDRYGHPAGDLVLCEFAARLTRSIRGSDLVVRMGGDEFLVLLPDCGLGLVQQVLARLRPLDVEFQGERISVTFAAGWTEFRPDDSPDLLVSRADHALYVDKRAWKEKTRLPAQPSWSHQRAG